MTNLDVFVLSPIGRRGNLFEAKSQPIRLKGLHWRRLKPCAAHTPQARVVPREERKNLVLDERELLRITDAFTNESAFAYTLRGRESYFPSTAFICHVEPAAKPAAHKGGNPWKRWDLLLVALLVGAEFQCKLLLIKDKRVKGIEPSFASLNGRQSALQ
jgi:hypothetical protein